jgi:hypothetical protein
MTQNWRGQVGNSHSWTLRFDGTVETVTTICPPLEPGFGCDKMIQLKWFCVRIVMRQTKQYAAYDALVR